MGNYTRYEVSISRGSFLLSHTICTFVVGYSSELLLSQGSQALWLWEKPFEIGLNVGGCGLTMLESVGYLTVMDVVKFVAEVGE